MEEINPPDVFTSSWFMNNGQNQDMTFLSSSRGILDTILEETSDDDEVCQEKWPTYDNGWWSSDSETGSVQHIDVLQVATDPDTISERDFACPPKRRRQDDLLTASDDTPINMQHYSPLQQRRMRLEMENKLLPGTLDLLDIPYSSPMPRRFRMDDLSDHPNSDQDTISFNSLSRSSSLVQFESLEKQFQTDGNSFGSSSFGGSTPSLYQQTNCLGADTNNEAQSKYYEYGDKVKSDHRENGTESAYANSNVTTSTEESSSSENSIYSVYHESDQDDSLNHHETIKANNQRLVCLETNDDDGLHRRKQYRNKNSVENLSEDSGYGELTGPMKRKSKSLVAFNPPDYSIQEEDLFGDTCKSVDNMYDGSFAFTSNHSIAARLPDDVHNIYLKIDESNGRRLGSSEADHRLDGISSNMSYDSKNMYDDSRHMKPSQNLSSSLPDILNQSVDGLRTENLEFINCNWDIGCTSGVSDLHNDDTNDIIRVSSVPVDLNICGVTDDVKSELYDDFNTISENGWNLNGSKYSWNTTNTFNSVINPYNKENSAEIIRNQNLINASYSNLTLLDYSGRKFGGSYRKMDEENKKRNSFEMSKGNFLLDELSEHFDRTLSILNDKGTEYEPVLQDFLDRERGKISVKPPQVPPRKPKVKEDTISLEQSEIPLHKSASCTINELSVPTMESHSDKTFDQDPTNLTTCYAESMERCNFDLYGSNNSFSEAKNKLYANQIDLSPGNKEFMSSTPNLNLYRTDSLRLTPASTHNSMNILTEDKVEKKTGILVASGGSRSSLGKGVSFCPVVSKISWQEQSSEEHGLSDSNSHNSESQDDDENLLERATPITAQCKLLFTNLNPSMITATHQSSESSYRNTDDDQVDNFNFNSKPTNIISEKCIVSISQSTESGTLNSMATSDTSKQHSNINNVKTVVESDAQLNSPLPTYSIPTTIKHSETIDYPMVSVDESLGSGTLVGEPSASTELNSNASKVMSVQQCNISASKQPTEPLHSINGGKEVASNKQQLNNNRRPNSLNAMEPRKFVSSRAGGTSGSALPTTNDFLLAETGRVNMLETQQQQKKKSKSNFLSRLANLRFSLRGKKHKDVKPHQVVPSQSNIHVTNDKLDNNRASVNSTFQRNYNINMDYQRNNLTNRSSVPTKTTEKDFLVIPLKEHNQKAATLATTVGLPSTIPFQETRHSIDNGHPMARDNNNLLISSKPPLPKNPPRVIGVCAKQNGRQQYAQRSSSAPRQIDYNDTVTESYYHNNNDSQYRGTGAMTTVNNYSSAYNTNQTSGTNRDYVKQQNRYSNINRQRINDGCEAADEDEFDENHKIGLIETNLDTDETVITGKTRSLMELGPGKMQNQRIPYSGASIGGGRHQKDGLPEPRRPHKSMEFLLDKENQKIVLPPENELQKSHDSTAHLSEHQLRVQASLQRLNIPDWYRQYNSTSNRSAGGRDSTTGGAYVPGSFTRKRETASGRWAGLNSKTTSLSSLGTRSDRSPVMLSPSAHSHQGHTSFSRWSTSQLNSSQTSPSVSSRSSFNRGGVLNSSLMSNQSGYQNSLRGSMRTPYLGWRSQERLSQPRTPAERLASSLKEQNHKSRPNDLAVTPEIQSSIKEVTSAIVHYVNDQTNRTSRSRSASPSGRNCWLESSFVGTRPLDSPQTPALDTTVNELKINGVASSVTAYNVHPDHTSPTMATLEDVLASLLGLPTDSYCSSTGTAANNMRKSSNLLDIQQNTMLRRHSEGDTRSNQPSIESTQSDNRRISLELNISDNKTSIPTTDVAKCRYPKCEAIATPADAKKNFKPCHNCAQLYCSRECRRAHWERHRKACLHSRISVLCRQALSTCKDDADTLRHLSLLARRGFLAQGRGVIRILFRSPENADAFNRSGYSSIGDTTYVRWPDLIPAEMGAELYSELLRLSTEYKPDSKMLIYVAICVVSEAPSSLPGAVKWERQLVSRCAKLKLCKSVLSEIPRNTPTAAIDKENMDILILTFLTSVGVVHKKKDLILGNILNILKNRRIVLPAEYPEIYSKIISFMDGTADRIIPITIHPREESDGRSFVCIILPTTEDSDKIVMPPSDIGHNVHTIDVSQDDVNIYN